MPDPSQPNQKYTIGVLVPHLTNPHFVALSYGYLSEAEKWGAEAVLFDAGGYIYLDKQIQQIEDLVAMGVDAICLVSISEEGTAPAVNRAVDAGIPVINTNNVTNSEKVCIKITSDNEEIGKIEAKYLAEKLNGKGNILMMNGVAGTTWGIHRSKGFKDYIQENYPEIKILDERWLDNSPEAGLKEMDDALQVYDNIDAVFTAAENNALGVVKAIESSGETRKILITSVDPSPEGIAQIRKGKIDMMVVQGSVYQGTWAIKAAINILEGKAKEMIHEARTPIFTITRDNVDTFNYVGVNSPPKDWKLPR